MCLLSFLGCRREAALPIHEGRLYEDLLEHLRHTVLLFALQIIHFLEEILFWKLSLTGAASLFLQVVAFEMLRGYWSEMTLNILSAPEHEDSAPHPLALQLTILVAAFIVLVFRVLATGVRSLQFSTFQQSMEELLYWLMEAEQFLAIIPCHEVDVQDHEYF